MQNPLSDWGNDDLLIKEETRSYVAARYPRLIPILDWPELRSLFEIFDANAGPARRASRRAGVMACILGYASLLITAALPLVTLAYPKTIVLLGPLAALMAAGSTIWGYSMVLHGQQKARWLSNRYWTERLRQLHFQLIINHLPLLEEVARGDPTALADLSALRATQLARFQKIHIDEVADAMEQMESDEAENEFWLNPAWEDGIGTLEPSPELDQIYEALVEQRFEVQRRFTNLKTAPGNWQSSTTRSRMVRIWSDIFTLVVLLTVIAGGILLGLGFGSDSIVMHVTTAIAGVSGGTIVLLRILNEGLQLSSESERYTWYKTAVCSLKQRFVRVTDNERREILRDMERLSYQEMRWFLMSFKQARFIM